MNATTAAWSEAEVMQTPDARRLALAILDHLDLGIVVCDGDLARVWFANGLARAILRVFDGRPGWLPASFQDAARTCLDAGARLEGPTAVPVRAPAGQAFFLRAKLLPSARRGGLVVVTTAVLRRADLADTLAREFRLTRRECQVVGLVRLGHTNEAIARALKLRTSTVKCYLTKIFESLGVRRRTELLAVLERLDVPPATH